MLAVDKKIGLTVVVMFLLVIIGMTIKAQVSSIETSAEFSRDTVSHTSRSAATVLHIMDSSEEHEFGKLEGDEFNDLMYNCGRSSGWDALEDDLKFIEEDNLDVCGPSSNKYSYWRDNGLLSGIVIEEEKSGKTGNQELSDWMVVG